MVLGLEVGCQWSEEAWRFVRLQVKAGARAEPPRLRRSAELAPRQGWGNLACMAEQLSLTPVWTLDWPETEGADGDTGSSAAVLEEACYALRPLLMAAED